MHNFVHADPHPGNLFVRPLEDAPSLAAEIASRAAEFAASAVAGEPVKRTAGAPFQLTFVDFGMVAEIPPRLRAALRKFLIGLGSRDAALVIQSLRDAGSLMPGADLAQLEEALEAVFDRFWGVDLGRLNKMLWNDAAAIWQEFGQLLQETPIQVQVDLMFVGRALELLSGITTSSTATSIRGPRRFPSRRRWRPKAPPTSSCRCSKGLRQLRLLAKLPAELSRLAGMAAARPVDRPLGDGARPAAADAAPRKAGRPASAPACWRPASWWPAPWSTAASPRFGLGLMGAAAPAGDRHPRRRALRRGPLPCPPLRGRRGGGEPYPRWQAPRAPLFVEG